MNKLPRVFEVYNVINEDGTISMRLRGSDTITYDEILSWYNNQKIKLDLDEYREDCKKLQIISYYYNSLRGDAKSNKKYYIYYNVFKEDFVIRKEESLSPWKEYFLDPLDAKEVLDNPNLRPIYDKVFCVGEPMECPFE